MRTTTVHIELHHDGSAVVAVAVGRWWRETSTEFHAVPIRIVESTILMPKTISEVRQQLSTIEPDEHTYEGLGPAEVDVLRQLLDDDETWLAARAVHALSRIAADSVRDAILAAAGSPRMEVRVAAAASAGSLSPVLSDEVLSTLLEDSQAGVRKFAIKSVSERNSESIKRRVLELATIDQDPGLQQIANEKARSTSLR